MLLFEATSFGGIHTTAERRARSGGDDIPPGFIRLSVGCEDAQDLIEDIEQALDSLWMTAALGSKSSGRSGFPRSAHSDPITAIAIVGRVDCK